MKIDASHIESMRTTLLSGRYQMLLGAGASIDSLDRDGKALPLGGALRSELAVLKGLSPQSTLQRAYGLLSEDEVENLITRRFSQCTAGPTLKKVTSFFWSRIYSLNIDDALENAYATSPINQSPVSITQNDDFQNLDDSNNLQLVHLHGFSRQPSKGYTFSATEYARQMVPTNTWASVLAQTLATEPFIVAGTSLQEPDLEFFLAGRSPSTVRTDRGPSFFIEPYPDAGTKQDCDRHGLILFHGTLLEFLEELDARLPARPKPIKIPAELKPSRFTPIPSTTELALFSKNVKYLHAREGVANTDLGFYVGREANLNDIALSRDIPRDDTQALKRSIRECLNLREAKLYIVPNNAGTGKSTQLLRCLFELAAEGIDVFYIETTASIDAELTAKILGKFDKPFILFCDNLADHVTNVAEFYRKINRADFCIVGAERSYRMGYVYQAIAGFPQEEHKPQRYSVAEARAQILKLNDVGLTSAKYDNASLSKRAQELVTDPIAVAGCRIMDDFRPISAMVDSLLGAADEHRRTRYLGCTIAAYCYRAGLPYALMASAFDSGTLKHQFSRDDVLPITFTDPADNDYVGPLNPVLAQQILKRACQLHPDLILDVYCQIGSYIAPYVNRQAIIKRTPEARLVSRLFDYDDVVSEFLGIQQSKKFFEQMKRNWKWNSRYWEQFALLKLAESKLSPEAMRGQLLTESIAHARHAVSAEPNHPMPMTTLGRILIEEMKVKPASFVRSFEEALKYLTKAISLEGQMNRIAIHPYMTLMRGVEHYLHSGGVIKINDRLQLQRIAETAEIMFRNDKDLLITLSNVKPLLYK